MAQNRIDIRGQQIEPVMLLDNGEMLSGQALRSFEDTAEARSRPG